jgi:hypothetical protein
MSGHFELRVFYLSRDSETASKAELVGAYAEQQGNVEPQFKVKVISTYRQLYAIWSMWRKQLYAVFTPRAFAACSAFSG